MCGRYASSRRPEDLIEEFEVVEARIEAPLEPNYNTAPTDETYVVAERPPHRDGASDGAAERQLRVMRWGLVPSWAKDPSIGSRMINARMETVAEKPAFRTAFEKRRCLVPADGYYEWYVTEQTDAKGRPRKQPFFIRPKDGRPLAMAGLYELWPEAQAGGERSDRRHPALDRDDPARWRWTCTVITTQAEDSLGRIHDRMPLMVEPDRWAQWLDPGQPGRTDLLVPATPGLLEAYPVRSLVSNVRNNGPELIEPLPVEESLA